MKACLLLFVGTIALVTAHYDPCDPIAADNELNQDKLPGQQVITQKEFYRIPRTTYFTNRASGYKGITEKNPYCTVATHEEGKCGAVTYDRWFAEEYKPGPGGFVGIQLKTVSWSVNTLTKTLIQYHIVYKGLNKDDFIFQRDDSVPVVAKEYKMVDSVAVSEDVKISDEVAPIIDSKFALHYANFEEGWAVYGTCDGKRIWSAITEKGLESDLEKINQINADINKTIDALKVVIEKEFGVKEPIVVHNVTTDIPEPYSDLLLAAKAA